MATTAIDKRQDGMTGTLAPTQQAAPVTLFGTDEPEQVVAQATRSAKALAKVVKDQKLTTKISNRDHVRVEGWTLLGSMLGVFPVCVWTRKLENGWEARVEARTRAGEIVGAAEAECLRSEKTWSSRDDYALRSMAQTRATSKALRQPLGFVMQLAGFDATPAEEMPPPATIEGFAAPTGKKAAPAKLKKLNALVDQLVAAEALSREQVEAAASNDFGTTLDALTNEQADSLSERLTKFAASQGVAA